MRLLKWALAALRGTPCPHRLYPALTDERRGAVLVPASFPCQRARYHPGEHRQQQRRWENEWAG